MLEALDQAELEEREGPYQIINYCDLVKIGKQEAQKNPEAFVQNVKMSSPEEIATIIYTSGTTGDPKGAVITNESFSALLNNIYATFSDTISSEDTFLIFLPLDFFMGAF